MGLGPGLSAIRAAAAGQRLDPLFLFARLLLKGCVAEVDVPVQARVGVVLGVRCRVEGITGWRYSVLVHISSSGCVGRAPGEGDLRGAIFMSSFIVSYFVVKYNGKQV